MAELSDAKLEDVARQMANHFKAFQYLPEVLSAVTRAKKTTQEAKSEREKIQKEVEQLRETRTQFQVEIQRLGPRLDEELKAGVEKNANTLGKQAEALTAKIEGLKEKFDKTMKELADKIRKEEDLYADIQKESASERSKLTLIKEDLAKLRSKIGE